MKIVLSGVETNNKGAELMLYSILQEIERKHPGSEVFLPISQQPMCMEFPNLKLNFSKLGVLQLWARKYRILSILRKLHLPCGILEDSYPIKNADYFLDASGYLFTDAWPMSNYTVEYFKEKFRNYHKQGTKIVFLPQAIGPLKKDITQKVLRNVCKYADIIMPRDTVSMNYVKSIGIDSDVFSVHGDFTSLIKATPPAKYSHLKGKVAIILNYRMIDQTKISKDVYFKFIAKVIETIRENGHDAYLLNHEGKEDENLMLEFKKTHDIQCEMVTGLNGLEVKGLISSAYLCITSRFHGVASALNSCVPCLATSWSHKYQELFNEYKQNDCLLDVTNLENAIFCVKELLGDSNNKVRVELQKTLPFIHKKTSDMWNQVWNIK